MTTIEGPGADDDADLGDPDDVLRRGVLPALRALLAPGEWADPAVTTEPDGLLWTCRVAGEDARRWLWVPGQDRPTLRQVAELVVDTVEDVVAESAALWGQRRSGAVVIPARDDRP